MRKVFAVSRRIWSQFVHDPRTLALLFIAPLFVLWLLSILLVSDTYQPRIATVELPGQFQQVLEKKDAHIYQVSNDRAMEMIAAGDVDAVASMDPGSTTLRVLYEGTNSTHNNAVKRVMAEAMSDFGDEARADLEKYVDDKKAEVEARKAEIEAKRDEIAREIENAKARAAEQRATAESNLQTVQGKLSGLAATVGQLKTVLDSAKAELKPLAATYPEVAAALQSLESIDLSGLSAAGLDASSLSIAAGSTSGLMNNVNIDALTLDDFDTSFNISIAEFMPVQKMETDYYRGSSSWEMFDFLGPIFIGLFLFVFVFITCSFSLVNERAAGTMDRFLDTPVRPVQVLAGYALGFGAMSLLQAAIILAFGLGVIGFPNEGNVGLVVLTGVSLALASVTMGLLVSGLARTSFQIVQLMLMFVVPQILLCGLFDLSASPDWLRAISACLPLTYGVDAMTTVMLAGGGFADIWLDLVVVWGFTAVFFVLASLRFTKKRAKKARSSEGLCFARRLQLGRQGRFDA